VATSPAVPGVWSAAAAADIGRSLRYRLTRLNVISAALLLAIMLLHAWAGLEVGRLGYVLSTSQRLSQNLERRRDELIVEYTAATAPQRLEEAAQARLGLRAPQPGQVVVLR
jgi:hypothetical protein